MTTTRNVSMALFGLALAGTFAPAQSRLTANTLALDEPANAPAASIDEVAWLAGRWLGQGFGGDVEETWSPALGGTMVGTFRLVQNDKPNFYEFLVLEPAGKSLAYQVKHFHPDLRGWEEKDDHVTFPLVRITKDEICFHGLTVRRDADGCTHYLAMKQKDGSHREMTLRYHRAPATHTPKERTTKPPTVADLTPLLGAWGPAEAKDRIVHDYAWTVGQKAMRLREGHAVGQPESSQLDGLIYVDPARQALRFVAVSGHDQGQGRVFQGVYRLHDDGRIERSYVVHYNTLADMPGEEPGGMTRHFREIYTITDGTLAATLDWWRDGRWQAFGPGKYALERRDG